MDQLEAEAGEDVRVLARLWQLQNKMESVGSGASYGGLPHTHSSNHDNSLLSIVVLGAYVGKAFTALPSAYRCNFFL